jgi:hypothetical protein
MTDMLATLFRFRQFLFEYGPFFLATWFGLVVTTGLIMVVSRNRLVLQELVSSPVKKIPFSRLVRYLLFMLWHSDGKKLALPAINALFLFSLAAGALADTPGHNHAHVRKPLLVGMLHGLAGSGALTLLAINTMPSLGQGLVFLLVFSVGIMATMIVLSGLISLPFRLTARLSLRLNQWIHGVAGIISIVLGLLIMWQTGLAGNLFHFLRS